MRFDLLEKVVEELIPILTGAKVNKIFQPSPSQIVIKFWNHQETRRLLIDVSPRSSRIHLTGQEFLNPAKPPRFCQLLRSRVKRIDHIEIINADRIIRLHCAGTKGDCFLIVELFGAKGNMILLDVSIRIIDCLNRVESNRGTRECLSGGQYQYPDRHERPDDSGDLPELDEGQTWNQLVEKINTDGLIAGHKLELKQQLSNIVARQLKRCTKRLTAIRSEMEDKANYESAKLAGEMLLANLHLMKRGMKAVEVMNYSVQPPVVENIALDPIKTPQENAEAYFKVYRKGKRGLEHCVRRIRETEEEIDWLEGLQFQLGDDVKKTDIEDIAEELKTAGLLKERNQLYQKRTQKPSQPYEASSPNGFKVVWGRNNKQNDFVSTKVLGKGDLWFHAHQCPGSHVVLKSSSSEKANFSEVDVFFAASIAAGYSKKSLDSKVEVARSGFGSVKKPKGAKPGLVVLEHYATIMVEPFRFDE